MNTPRELFKAFILLITSTLIIMADFTIAPVLPKIKEAFIDTPNIDLLVKMSLTLPALFVVLSSPLIGYLTDKYGRKKIIMNCIVVYILSGTFGYFAGSIYALLVSRAIFGIAISGIITGCSTLINDYYKGPQLSRMVGVQSCFIGYGGLLYIIIGGILADFNWRNTFLIYLSPIVLLFLFYKFIDDPEMENKSCTPLQSLNFKKYAKIYIAAFGLMMFFYMIPLQIPFHLKAMLPGIKNTQIGFTIAIVSFCSATASIFYKSAKNHMSFRSLFIFPFIVIGLGFITVSLYHCYLCSVIGLVFAGTGLGLVVTNLRVWIGSISNMCVTGRAFGGLNTSFYLGQVCSPLLINTISGSFAVAGLIIVAMSLMFVFNKPQSKSGGGGGSVSP